ncbi:transcriptional regulator BetI [Palleronia sediminis]|uniref:HTH-type transcriptional regulator BetI n=1 Tax=Palleronia sediminis TaxID=2547833 RepID=A0A4R6A5S4_9RHOB|nr:transcriptional regulator BetI [Palleronia sediminis]TDL78205.1 transcriptional regulator BetI [Palleronia sediminis]
MATLVSRLPGKSPVETRRKAELIDAAIAEIGAAGSLDVSVGRIAKRAGMSAALAFHYFGGKDALLLEALRHVLGQYGASVRQAVAEADGPRERARAIVRASFGPQNFGAETVSAWLNFYVFAYRAPQARRLLAIYHARLRSNLTHALRPLVGARAPAAAERIGAMIDGFYIRATCTPRTDSGQSEAHVLATLDDMLREVP